MNDGTMAGLSFTHSAVAIIIIEQPQHSTQCHGPDRFSEFETTESQGSGPRIWRRPAGHTKVWSNISARRLLRIQPWLWHSRGGALSCLP